MTLAAPLAIAQEPTLDGLEEAIQQRVDEISSTDPIPRELADEGFALAKALDSLQDYQGSFDNFLSFDLPLEDDGWLRELGALTKVTQGIFDSETADGDVLFQVDAIRDTLETFGRFTAADAAAAIALVTDNAVQESVEELLEFGDAARLAALDAWPRSLTKGMNRMSASVEFYVTGADEVARAQVEESLQLGTEAEPTEVVLPDEDPVAFEPYTVNAKINLPAPTPRLTLSVRAMSEAPPNSGSFEGGSPGEVEAVQATVGLETLFDLPAGELNHPIEVEMKPFPSEEQVEVDGFPSELAGLQSTNRYGASLDIDGNYAVVGAPCDGACASGASHRVFVHERYAGGFDAWNQTAELFPYGDPSLATGDTGFGESVAVSGDLVVVGAPREGVGGTAFVYQLLPSGPSFVTSLTPENQQSGSMFGTAVGVSGQRIVVGAPDYYDCEPGELACYEGAVFVFEKPQGIWTEIVNLYSKPFRESLFQFAGSEGDIGEELDIDGDMVAVSGLWAFGTADGVGLGFTRPIQFVFQAVNGEFLPENSDSFLLFGAFTTVEASRVPIAVDEASGTVVAGVPTASWFGEPKAGTVMIWRDSTAAAPPDFDFVGFLSAPNPNVGDCFGASVALDGSTVIVGSPGHDHPMGAFDGGSVYIYVEGHEPGCPPNADPLGWGLLARRVAKSTSDQIGFGSQVAATEDTYLVAKELGTPNSGKLDVFNGMAPFKSGTYQFVVQVDPQDQLVEISELGDLSNEDELAENAKASVDAASEAISVEFCVPALDQPNLSVVSAEFVPLEGEQGYVIFDQDGQQLTKTGLNVVVRMTGSFEGPLGGCFLTAGLAGGPAGSFIEIWNPEESAYEFGYPLPDLMTGDELSLSLDVRVPGGAAAPGVSLPVNYDVDVSVSISAPFGVNEIDPSNNTVTLEDQNYTQLELVSCDFVQAFETEFGNDDFKIGADISGSLALAADLDEIPGHDLFPAPAGPFGLSNQAEMGAIGSLSGGVPFTFFGEDLGDLVRARALAERDPTYQVPGFAEPGYGFIGADLQFLNILDSTGPLDIVMAWGPYDSTVIDPQAVLPDGFELTPDAGFKLTLDDFTVEKEKKKKKIFFPGGFPVTVEAGAKGVLGVDLVMTVGNAVTFDVAPTVDFGVAVSFSLGVCEVLCVGAEAKLSLIKETFTVRSGLGLVVAEEVDIAGDLNKAICAVACFTVDNDLSTLDGEFNVFAITPWVDWCWVEVDLSFFGTAWIPYPCKFYLKKFEFEIISWDGFGFSTNLIDEAIPACSVQLQGFVNCAAITGSQACGSN